MSELVLAVYGQEDTAAYVAGVLHACSRDLLLDLDPGAIVRVGADGRFSVTTTAGPGQASAAWGVLWGALFGLVFLVPAPGTAYGPNLGGVFGALDRAGLDADFRARVRGLLGRESSGLAFLAMDRDPELVLDQLCLRPTSLLRASLSPEQDAELAESYQLESRRLPVAPPAE